MRIARPVLISATGFIALLAIFSFKANAGEGQWLPEQIASLDFAKFAEQGLELSPDDIWNGEEGVLSAAVHINGCSSSFVSNKGLIVTNHHCGFAAINEVSTVEKNYLEEGFVADTMADEIPAPGYKVSFV
ncbi:MAG: S46 family peptidase, partial [Planctomycetota bacterium]|nr:S46 family peptidase [Planctomycetota bacterium]